MAKWTTEKMVEELKALLGGQLVSVVLYGSAAAGDHTGKHSDINLLVVTKTIMPRELLALSKAVVPWTRQGNPPPLFLTQKQVKHAPDVFPIEILDIQHNHRVLHGPDPVKGLKVSHDDLRVELEHEFRGKLMRLKTRFMLTEARPSQVEKLMVESLSTFLVLFKSALWLYGIKPSPHKMESLRELKEYIAFDIGPFETVDRLKHGERIRDLNVLVLFEKYLNSIEAIVDNVK